MRWGGKVRNTIASCECARNARGNVQTAAETRGGCSRADPTNKDEMRVEGSAPFYRRRGRRAARVEVTQMERHRKNRRFSSWRHSFTASDHGDQQKAADKRSPRRWPRRPTAPNAVNDDVVDRHRHACPDRVRVRARTIPGPVRARPGASPVVDVDTIGIEPSGEVALKVDAGVAAEEARVEVGHAPEVDWERHGRVEHQFRRGYGR